MTTISECSWLKQKKNQKVRATEQPSQRNMTPKEQMEILELRNNWNQNQWQGHRFLNICQDSGRLSLSIRKPRNLLKKKISLNLVHTFYDSVHFQTEVLISNYWLTWKHKKNTSWTNPSGVHNPHGKEMMQSSKCIL